MLTRKLIKSELAGTFVLAGWAMLAVAGIAFLGTKHLASLPEPGNEVLLSRSVLKLRHRAGKPFLVHVIYSECSCSKSLLAHLLARRTFPDSEELILFVGRDAKTEQAAQRSGFEFSSVSDSELVSRFGLEAAPVLLVFDAGSKLRYAGGYYDHPATITPLDEKIHEQLAVGANVQPLPVFGCAISGRLQKSLDPFRRLRDL